MRVYCCIGKKALRTISQIPIYQIWHVFDAAPVFGVCLSFTLLQKKKKNESNLKNYIN